MKIFIGVSVACIAVVVVFAVIGSNLSMRTANRTPSIRQHGWNHKAMASVRKAAHLAGGFTNEDVRAYKNGLEHINNEHLHLGAFTIAEVVDQENQRMTARVDAEKSAKQAAQDAANERKARATEAAALANAKQQDHIMAASRAAEEDTMHGDAECLTMDRKTEESSAEEYVQA